MQCKSREWARTKSGWSPPLPRACTVCYAVFVPDHFHPEASACSKSCGGRQNYLLNISARFAYNRQWTLDNPEKRRQYHRTNYARNIVEKRIQRKARLSASVSKAYFLAMCAAQGFSCNFCKAVFPPAKLSIDHIHPVSKGGGNAPTNLHILCLPCNQRKGNRLFTGLIPTIP